MVKFICHSAVHRMMPYHNRNNAMTTSEPPKPQVKTPQLASSTKPLAVFFDWRDTLYDPKTRTLKPGALQTLIKLRNSDIPIAVISGDRKSIVAYEVERFLSKKDFPKLRVYGEGMKDLRPKPEPDMIFDAMDKYGLSNDEAIRQRIYYVGDNPIFDMEMAKEAGIKFILFGPQDRYIPTSTIHTEDHTKLQTFLDRQIGLGRPLP
jgi:phosphoglycolate phosphatase-like HAD superfamily hydrolase